MFEALTESIWAGLALVFVNSLGVGGVLSYSTWQNEIKDIYLLSQTQGKYFFSFSHKYQ